VSRSRFTASERHRLPVRAKVAVARLAPPPALYRCCECGVKVTSQDQAGHAQREHNGRARYERT
jgi:hypothetical protein